MKKAVRVAESLSAGSKERKAGRDPDVALEASVFALVEQMQAEDIHT